MFHQRTAQAAKGKWRGIMMALGMPESFLQNKGGPCPLCGGTDRFRWDNKRGEGTYICNQCGSGKGMKLAENYTGIPFPEIATKIDGILGNIKPRFAHITSSHRRTRINSENNINIRPLTHNPKSRTRHSHN